MIHYTNMTQAEALAIMKMGKNIFLTGGAGAGKTYVLNQCIRYFQEHDVSIAVTASTGIAATHIGGMTIHAWSGMGIKEKLSDWDIDQLEEKKYLWDRYQKVKVLVIDEISMLSGTFLDSLNKLCQAMKRNTQPFGGIQVILCGDLFQLPPITQTGWNDMVIDSESWGTMSLVVCYITEQHRQESGEFVEVLNAIRSGEVKRQHIHLLESRVCEYDFDSFQSYTKLFTHNQKVDALNEQALHDIYEEPEVYMMTSKGKENLVATLKKSCLAPEKLSLKIGAEVMFVKNNFELGYVNGTRGRVVDFSDDGFPVVETKNGDRITAQPETWAVEDEGKILASINQIPLRHAWAITVHKSQGMSLDAAVIDLSQTFAYGMGYVALSRVRTLEGLHLIGFQESALMVDPRILTLDKKLRDYSDQFVEKLKTLTTKELEDRHNAYIVNAGGSLHKKKEIVKEKLVTRKTHEITFDLLQQGKTLYEIKKERDLNMGTIIDHLQKCKDEGKLIFDYPQVYQSVDQEVLRRVREAFEVVRESNQSIIDVKLTAIKRYLDAQGLDDNFDTIKLARLFID